MKGKTLLSLAIVLAMILSAVPFATVKSAPPTTISVVFPNGLNHITETVGTTFTVSINISTTKQVAAYKISLAYNTSMLSLKTNTTSDVAEGPWMKAFGTTIFGVDGVDPVHGYVNGSADNLLSGSATGSGTMFTVQFTAEHTGVMAAFLNIANPNSMFTYLLNATLTGSINIDAVSNGLVSIPIPPATPPTAIITTPLNLQSFTVGSLVSLDGSHSLPGYNTLPPPGESVPITIWNWTVVNSSGTYHYSGATTSFTCTSPGAVTITLEVIAPATPPIAPTYVNHSSTTITIYQVAPAVGPKIDVYTARGGKGLLGAFPYPYGWSDAYAPQELVCVYANVTYNNAPVWYKPVEFVVYLPNGTEIASYEAFTNESGIAKVCFRIPWEANMGPSYFGNMSITGTVSISQVQVMDTVKFPYGWILEINNIAIANAASLHRSYDGTIQSMSVNVTICSIEIKGGPNHPAYLQITAVDNAGVPFGQAFSTLSVPYTGTSVVDTIIIPEWAYVGTGTLYVDLLNSNSTGVPWCPEATASFAIVYP